jgi:hypothetical protein
MRLMLCILLTYDYQNCQIQSISKISKTLDLVVIFLFLILFTRSSEFTQGPWL